MQDCVSVVSWRTAQNLGGNPYGMSPKPEMLIDGGIIVRRKYTQLGRGSNPTKTERWMDVQYDEEYVAAWLENQVLHRLHGIPYNQLQKLLSRAIALHKQRLKEFDIEQV